MMARALAVAFAFLAVAVVPTAQAQEVGIQNPEVSTPTVMYFHPINIQDFPINTQIPQKDWKQEVEYGLITPSLTCVSRNMPQGHENTGGIETAYHVYRGYSSPSYVEYDYIENGVPRTHPERGISYDAIFDQSVPAYVYWYLRTSSQVPGQDQADNAAPLPIPNVVVQATLKAGDQISIDDKAYDSGQPVATGKTPAATLTGLPGDQAVVDDPAGPGDATEFVRYVGNDQDGKIYEFKVPLSYETDKVTRANGFNIRIDAYIEQSNCDDFTDDGHLMYHTVNAYSGALPGFEEATGRPRMTWNIMNPIRLEYLHPQFVGDDLVVHTSMNSAWGNYDVHEETIAVSIEGPSAATSLARAAIVQRTHEHYHHQEAVDVTYVWPYKVDRAQNGLYTVLVEFSNDQQTAKATGVAQFEIGKGIVIGCGGIQESAQRLNDDCAQDLQRDGAAPAKKSPGVELVAILGALALALVAVRRRNA